MVHWLTEVRNLPAPLPIRFNRMRLFSVLVASYFSFGFCFTGALPARISFCLSFFWAFRSSFFAIVYLGFCSCGFFLGFLFFITLTFFKPFLNRLSDELCDEGDRFRRVVVGWDWKIDVARVGIRIYHSKRRDVQLKGLTYCNVFFLHIDNE